MRLSLACEMRHPVVDDHAASFSRSLEADDGAGGAPAVDLSGGSGQVAPALWNEIDADTLADRGVLVAGNPGTCLRAISMHEAVGVDEIQFLMATETVDRDRVMSSIEVFGTHVTPELRKRATT